MVQAVIMAGGEGARLRPLTTDLPKPMAPVANRPIMHHIVNLLRRQGVTEAFATLHYLADEVESYFRDGSEFGVRLEYSVEDTPLGTAGSVRRLMDRLEGTVLVISGDALTDFELPPAIAFHRAQGAAATLVLTRVANPLEYGVVITDEEGRVRRFLEKPSPGEVFSDTVNTGIYLLEPRVLARVSTSKPVDFSRDLFPALLADGEVLCGYVAEGYWTDVGGLEQYQAANHDCLKKRVKVEMPGEEREEGIWVGEETRIHPAARLEAPVLIGHRCTIGPGAHVGPLSVIGDNCTLEPGVEVNHAVIWSGCYLGTSSRVRGATVCREVVAKSHVNIQEGAVVGDRCLLGEGTTVLPEIRIWPHKYTERGSKVTMSLIWGPKWPGMVFGASGVSGLANVEITPEFAAKLGAAFGAYLEAGAQVITSRDSHHVSRMIKRAMIAGLMSVGATALDLRTMPAAVARHMAHIAGSSGGLHVSVSPTDPGQTLIEFFDEAGRNLTRAAERKIESIFFREDFRRAPREAVGGLEFLGRTMEYYTEDFLNFVDSEAIRRWSPRLVVDYCYGPLCLLMPLVLGRLGCEATALNAFVDPVKSYDAWARREQRMAALGEVLSVLHANLGLVVGSHGDRFAAVDEDGVALSGDELLLAFSALVLREHGPGAKIAAPLSATSGVEEVCTRFGARCVRTKADARSLMERAGDEPELTFAGDSQGGFIFPHFLSAFDAMLAVGKLLELLAKSGKQLREVRRELPQYARADVQVECPWEHKGTIMRRLHEESQALQIEHLDGLKIHFDGDWVLVLPDLSAPRFHVRAESTDPIAAEALAHRYAARIGELQEEL
jgi:mannose-1-phosphate guanylyltransferase/phosphomannomutase